MQQCSDPGTPNAAPKQNTVLTWYFAFFINLGRGVPTRPVKACGHFRPGIREAASGFSAASCRMAAADGRRW